MLFRRWAKKRQAETGQIYPVFTIGTAAILGLPVFAFFLAGMPASLDQPALATFNIRGGMVLKPEFTALWFALSVYTRSEEHTSELQSLMRISYAVFCLKKKTNSINNTQPTDYTYHYNIVTMIHKIRLCILILNNHK